MIASAHQPHYLPWIGYINKIHLSDVFMLMDNMYYTNSSYINRNRIIGKRGIIFLNVPLIKPYGLKTKINELIIDTQHNSNWNIKHLKSIQHNYSKGIGFNDFFPQLENLLMKKHELYFDMLFEGIRLILNYLEITTKIQLGSEKNTSGTKETELVPNIIKDAGCDEIILGLGASTRYVDFNQVKKLGYNVLLQQFEHPIYNQKYSTFVKGVSIIDLILNVSKSEATYLVKNCGSIKRP